MPSCVGINITTASSPIIAANTYAPDVIAMKIIANTINATITSAIE